MGAKPEDTQREITRLRGDMTAALDELESRVRGGLRKVATVEARIASVRAGEDVVERARDNPTMLGVAGMVGAGAVAYGAFAVLRGLRERSKPQNRLKRRVRGLGDELSGRLGEGVQGSRRQLERARQHALLLKLDPQAGGYVRVVDARLESLNKKRGTSTVIKKFVWAGLLAVFMALGSVVARRVADTVWRAAVHEDPPTAKSKAAGPSGMLAGEDIRRRHIVALPDLAAEQAHLQPNGVDLSLDAVWRLAGPGALGRATDARRLPRRDEVAADADDWWDLAPGSYGIRYGEWVELPVDCGGLCFPRSSLLRMGLHVPTAVWDAGYAGRGEGLLLVDNPHGTRLQRGARIVQLVVFRLTQAASAGYAGAYQHENAEPARTPQ